MKTYKKNNKRSKAMMGNTNGNKGKPKSKRNVVRYFNKENLTKAVLHAEQTDKARSVYSDTVLAYLKDHDKNTKYPVVFLSVIVFPSLSSNAGSIPGKGNVAEPGFVGTHPGIGDINIPPVSVCHHVSTIGHFSFPITWKYQCHSGDLIGSPTVPKTRKLDKSYWLGKSSPSFINARNAVGAV